jgi:peptide deformylase
MTTNDKTMAAYIDADVSQSDENFYFRGIETLYNSEYGCLSIADEFEYLEHLDKASVESSSYKVKELKMSWEQMLANACVDFSEIKSLSAS